MARKASKTQQVEPENETQEVTEPDEPHGQPEAGGGKISKTEAAYRALDAGHDKPLEAVDYIRKTFGIEIGAQHFSSIKSNRKKRSDKGPKRRGLGRKASGATRATNAASPKGSSQRASAGDTDLLDDMAAVKHLVEKMGAEKVRKIVDLFE
jgi:hypothetical protein